MSGSQSTLAPVIGVYETIELVHVVHNLKTPQQFLLKKFFPNVVESDTEEVAIDVDVGKRRMAPFCSPLVRGKLVESRQWSTNIFKPPYIKDKRVPDLMRPVRRQIGEQITGSLSPRERYEANVAFELTDQIEMIDRRLEWMASSALQTGTITIVGEGYPNPIVINFLRDSSLTVTLTGAAQWGQPNVYPDQNIIAWSSIVLQKSGAAPTDIVFTNTPWQAFLASPGVRASIFYPRSGANDIQYGGTVQKGAIYMGHWGQFDLWLYNDWYVDPVTDLESPLLPDGTVILTSENLDGLRSFGLIKDPEFAYGPLAYAPKMWIEKDPAQLNMLMQSAPLVVPSRVNASFCATVCAPGASIPYVAVL